MINYDYLYTLKRKFFSNFNKILCVYISIFYEKNLLMKLNLYFFMHFLNVI